MLGFPFPAPLYSTAPLAAVEPFQSVLKRLSTTTRQSGRLFFKTTQNKYEKNEARKNCHGWHVLPSSLLFQKCTVQSAIVHNIYISTYHLHIGFKYFIWIQQHDLENFEFPFGNLNQIFLSFCFLEVFLDKLHCKCFDHKNICSVDPF